MKKIAFLGFLLIIMPFLGFPNAWENIIYSLLGLVILIQSLYLLRKISLLADEQNKNLKGNVYVENSDYSIKGE